MSGDAIFPMNLSQSRVVPNTLKVKGIMITCDADLMFYPTGKDMINEFRVDGYELEGYALYSYTAMQVVTAALGHAALSSKRR